MDKREKNQAKIAQSVYKNPFKSKAVKGVFQN